MYSFPSSEPVHCSMSRTVASWLAYTFLRRQVVWYSHLFKNFPEFVVVHTVKGFSIAFAFPIVQWMLAIWSLVPLSFLNPAHTSGSSWFTCFWNLAWRILSITLLACEIAQLYASLNLLGHCLLWDWNENWPFPVLWPLLIFLNFLILSVAL